MFSYSVHFKNPNIFNIRFIFTIRDNTGAMDWPEAGLKDCSGSLVRESEEWGEVAEEDMAAADTDIDKEDTGDWRLFLMDMGAIPPQPGYMQPVTHTSLEPPNI